MSIVIESEGRRHYLVGNTYPIKGAIKAAGCSWDPNRGAWWTGKREVAEQLLAGLASGAVQPVARWVKLPTGFGVLVPAGAAAEPGAKVRVSSRDGGVKEVELAAVVETQADGARVFAVPPRKPVSTSGAPRRRSNWRACGYPGCSPDGCDECDGEGMTSGFGRYGRRYGR